MIAFLVAVAALLGFAMLIAYASGKPLEVTLLPTCCAAIIALFVGGAAGHLATTQAWVLRIGVIALTIAMITTRARCLRWLAEPGPVLIGALLLFVAWINRNGAFIFWDEFSHWGHVSRFLHDRGTFPTSPSEVMLLDYPFGTGLFHYVFSAAGAYSEISAINSQAILQAASFLSLFAGQSWRQWPIAICLAAISLCIGYAFFLSQWTNVLIDNTLAIVAAGAILVYWRGGTDWRAILLAAPVLASLPLLKSTGAFFAFAGLAAIGLDLIAQSVGARRLLFRSFCAITLAATAVWIVRRGWQAHVYGLNAGATFPTSTSAILNRLNTAEFGPYAASLVQAFVRGLFATPIEYSYLDTVRWTVAIIAVGALSTLVRPTWNWFARAITFHSTLVGAFAIYVAGLLALYLFSFTIYEGLRLQSFGRYLGCYILFWLVATLALLVPDAKGMSWRSMMAGALLLVVATGSAILAQPHIARQIEGPYPASNLIPRQTVKERLGYFAAHVPVTAGVYIVWTGTPGLEHRIARYELTPRRSPTWCWSPGPPRFSGDIWSCDWSLDEATSILAGYDYLFIGHADDIFWSKYGSLFAPGAQEADTRWFKFETDSAGRRVLTPVFNPQAGDPTRAKTAGPAETGN